MKQLKWLFLYKKLQTRKFKGNLDLEKLKIPSWFRIPDNLEIEGYLDLSQTNISKLPKNLQCENLYLEECKNIKELPKGLKVKDIINLSRSSIERLSKNLQCNDLILTDCRNIKQLPNDIRVNDEIILTNCLIQQLPKNLVCKSLYLYNCKNLKKLPEGLKVKYLFITNCSLTTEYCEEMKQKGKISYINLYY